MAHIFLVALLLALAYALAGHFGTPKTDGDRGPLFWACGSLAVVCFIVFGWAGAGFAVAWFGWRLIAGRDVLGAGLLHHLAAIPLAIVAAWIGGHHGWFVVGARFAVWAALATSLGWARSRWEYHAVTDANGDPEDDPSGWLGILCDAAFGAAAALTLA